MFNVYSLKNGAFKQDDNVSHMRKFYISSIHIFFFIRFSILICQFYICKSKFSYPMHNRQTTPKLEKENWIPSHFLSDSNSTKVNV